MDSRGGRTVCVGAHAVTQRRVSVVAQSNIADVCAARSVRLLSRGKAGEDDDGSKPNGHA